jgi:ribonuclease BN
MPNTRVRFMPALTSALVAGVCWQSAGWGFARFVAGSSQYTAIYSSLAIIIIFMIWLYVSWLVVLVGASVGFYMQHTECLMASPGEEPRLSSQSQDQLALAIMQTLGERYLQGSMPLQAGELAQRFHTPGYAIDAILEALAARGIVVRTDRTDPPGWIPGRDLGNITPWQVLEAVRHAGEIHPPDPAADDTIQTFFYAQDQMSAVLSTISFRDLLTRPAGSRTVLTPSLAGGGAGAVAASLQAVAASAAPVLPHAQIMGGVALPDEELGGGVGLRSTAQRRAALQQLERQAQREGRQATPAARVSGDDDWDAIPTGTGRLCATDAAAMASSPAVAAPTPSPATAAAAASPATTATATTGVTATTAATTMATTTTAATSMATTAAATTPTGMATTTAATTSASMASPSTSGQRFPFVASPLFHPEGNDAPLTADTPVPDASALGDKAGADPDVPVFATTLSDEGETLIAVPVTGILPPQREEVRKTPRPGISPRRPAADAPSPGNA